MSRIVLCSVFIFLIATERIWSRCDAQILDKQQQLEGQKFWDNRDWNWYKQNIPFFECPDADITTTYYYRWELLTKHLTYGSPDTGYLFTEFIDRPFWSGAYGAISCPAGHQLYEARWLRKPLIANDYTRYWFKTPGAQPRNYSTWIADAAWAVHQVHPDKSHLVELLSDFVKNYEGWEKRHFVKDVGLFWQTGHDDGMEFNINSRQTKDILRGAPSYRPSFNAYMWADAVAIARIANLAGDKPTAERFLAKASSIKDRVQALLWDEKRHFFFPMFRDNEERDGHMIQAGTLTYQTGQFAGDSHGRELIGYVPWQFNMLDHGKGFEIAWQQLMARDAFYADFGPTTVERNDPMFLLKNSCCWWSGQSWPYATTQTLKGLANLLQNNEQSFVSSSDYVNLLQIYARSHRKDGKPYLAEALHPDSGSFEGHDGYNHSEHYFHSGYCDLVISGLVGLTTRDDDVLEIQPLAPSEWDYFALDDVPYRNHLISILWDRAGTRYSVGQGLTVLVDGKLSMHSKKLESLRGSLAIVDSAETKPKVSTCNFAVNNDGTYYPRMTASFTSPQSSIAKLNDGNYWYVQHPPNRWTCQGSPNASDWVVLDFGVVRSLQTLKLFFLDDGDSRDTDVRVPKSLDVEAWVDDHWATVELPAALTSDPSKPSVLRGHTATEISLNAMRTSKLRVRLEHQPKFSSGLTEIEAWGEATLPLELVPPPAGNLAYNPNTDGFPKATASFSDRFGGLPSKAIDGRTVFLPTPMNRWTSYESKTATDWLEIDFGKSLEFRRVEMAIYDDRGGVQPPAKVMIQHWTGTEWRDTTDLKTSPERPAGGQWNVATFAPVQSSKVRIVLTHEGAARSGVTEVLVWND
jgi:hypothetical protein